MKYQVFSIEERQAWNYYIQNSLHHDFYHTCYYHSLQKNGEPFVFVYEKNNIYIALPLLKRQIPNTPFVDFTSAYGYSGPVSNREFSQMDSEIIEGFINHFLDFVKKEKCVSVFSRLNPFIDQQILLEKLGGVYPNGKTVYMDLSIPLEDQQNKYEKRLRRRIKQLRRKSFQIREASSQNDIHVFSNLYKENMDRLNASGHYYFEEEYFSNMVNSEEFKCFILMIYDEEVPICGAIVVYSDNIIRNHLSATSADYVKVSPSKLLTDEISLIGRKLGLRYFHMGGGVGGKEDSLFYFKSGFSDLYLEDKRWCYVADRTIYDDLVQQKGIDIKDTSFFPLYRK